MADARVEQARALAAAGQYKEAVEVLKALLQANAQDGEARQLLAEVQDSMMLEIQIGDRLERAQALAEQGQRDQALKLLGDVMKVAPNHPRALALAASLSPQAPPPPRPLPDLNPNATVSMDAFELEDLPIGSGPASPAGPSSSTLSGAAPEFNLESLDSLDSSQLSPMESTFATQSTNLGPAEAARVQQYVSEGQSLFDQGRYQDAIDLWTRVFIVDENNKDADALIAKAKEAMNANQGEIEHNLTEGIAAFNAADYVRSKPLLEKVLAAFPGHREAQYYLQRMGEAVPMSPQAWTDAPTAPVPPSAFATPPPAFTPPPPTFSAPPPISGAAPGEAPHGSTFTSGNPDEFEFEDHLELPTGEAMRSSAPAASYGGFEFESAPPALAGAGQTAPQPPTTPPAQSADTFTWDDNPTLAAPQEQMAATTGMDGGDEVLGVPGALPGVGPSKVKAAKAPKAGGGPPWILIGAAVFGLLLVGLGIVFASRFFFSGDGLQPATVKPSQLPKPQAPRIAPKPVVPAVPGAPTPQSMSPEDLLKAARAAEGEKDYAKAVALYQELLARGGGLNTEAATSLSNARTALQRQQVENEKNEKFLKDYQYAVKAYREGDFAECLRVAWRMIYPDDTMARQLGKRDAVQHLIRDGYYNWAVMDLKSDNVRGAEKNLRDLVDFDKTDGEARKLLQFVRPYLANLPDQNYRDVVKSLAYRPFTESP